MSKLIRRLTNRAINSNDQNNTKNNDPPPRLESGETTNKAIAHLGQSLAAYEKSTVNLISDVVHHVDRLWNYILHPAKETAPQRKYELAEQLLHHPEVMQRLLVAFVGAEMDTKRKIRDLFYLVESFTSNDSVESCVIRQKNNSKSNPKFNQLLYKCRFQLFMIIQEGRSGPESVGLYNDIIRIFAKDNDVLTTIFKDMGEAPSGKQKRTDGCVWKMFERLLTIEGPRGFHVYAGFFETVEILFCKNHAVVHRFLMNNTIRFIYTMHKLILINNFYIQAKALKFLRELLSHPINHNLRCLWMDDPNLIKSISWAIQRRHTCVRREAVAFLNIFIQNQNNSVQIHEFIDKNRNLFIKYCWENAPCPNKEEEIDETEDILFADMAFTLMAWNCVRKHEAPQNWDEARELDRTFEHYRKIKEEQTFSENPDPRQPKRMFKMIDKSSGIPKSLGPNLHFGKGKRRIHSHSF